MEEEYTTTLASLSIASILQRMIANNANAVSAEFETANGETVGFAVTIGKEVTRALRNAVNAITEDVDDENVER
jgi:hypothetical protein